MKMALSKDKKILFANFLPKNTNYYRRCLTNYSNFAEKSCKDMNTLRIVLILLLVLVANACSKPDKAQPKPIMRVDLALASYDYLSEEQRSAVLDSMGSEIRAMMAVVGIKDITDSILVEWSKSGVVKMFQPPVDSVFSDIRPLEQTVGDIVRNASKEGIDLPHLSFASVVWGSQRPMVRTDSIVLIALNHYLGADFPGYAGWQEYRRAIKTPDMIPYDLAGVLAATQYPMADNQPTLLSWMLYEGALVEGRMRLVPDATLDKALGYSRQQLEFAKTNLKRIWEEMRLLRIVYDTDPLTIDKYIALAPSTPLLQGTTPGRIGRYVGYCIVRAYLSKHPETPLPQLLSPAFYTSASTLINSGFNP